MFLSVFILVRQYTGGYHADTYVRCNAAFVLTYLLTVGIWIFCRVHDLKVAVWFILLGAYIIMAVLAPVENKNKPLDDEEVKKYKWKSIVIYSAFLAADITGVFYEVCLYIKIILIIIVVLMVLGKFKENLTE